MFAVSRDMTKCRRIYNMYTQRACVNTVHTHTSNACASRGRSASWLCVCGKCGVWIIDKRTHPYAVVARNQPHFARILCVVYGVLPKPRTECTCSCGLICFDSHFTFYFVDEVIKAYFLPLQFFFIKHYVHRLLVNVNMLYYLPAFLTHFLAKSKCDTHTSIISLSRICAYE